MNKFFSQADRKGRLSTVLGKDALVLLRMDGTEELSGDFEWRVEALSTQAGLDLHSLLGTHATVEIEHASGTRAFDGIVTEASAGGSTENGLRYDLTLRPWLHVAGLRRNMRIFHNKTVIQIAREVLSAYASLGDPHLEVQVTDDYPALEYTVQYGETDAEFVRRQLERHGISWSWRHDAGSHTLRLTDAEFSLPQVPGGARPYYSVDGFHQHDEEHFSLWSSAERITTGAVRLTEYNFKIPTAAQQVDHTGDATHPSGGIESYDWPGDYLEQGEGRGVVNRRMQAERGQAPRHRATGDVVSLGAGWRVTLEGDEVLGATGRTFVCLKAEHRFRAQAYGSGSSGTDETPYEGSYVLMPDDTPYRPERRRVGPRVQGPETAVVVGEGEIDCDEHGRILCRFHWDDTGANTMRVRVSQTWASKGWGGMVIPRIGMEVIVEHLRGDPDKPIVTGCVYNGKNESPYPLPEHKTKSVFRSDSHQSKGFNELAFEDATGAENISMHAQKDQTLKVLNNRMKRVDNDQVESVGQNKSIEVGNNHQERVGGSMNLTVGGSKAPLFGALAAIAGQATSDALNVASEAGDASIPAFMGAVVAQTVGGEVASGPAIGAFDAAGQNRAVAGAAQVATGTALGGLLSSVMPLSGVKNTVVEKFVADTVGLARTEQIGAFKNTMVGAVQNTLVGAKQFTKIGQEQRLKVGKTKTAEIGDEYTTHTGRRVAHSSGNLFQISSAEKFEGTSKVWEIKAEDTILLSAPGGYVEITKRGVKIRGLKVEIEGNAIDFKSGGPGEGSKCLRAMAKSATPFVR
ncbi:type VI secretion system Vgr family protein [Aestuariibius insulae]|uniref:type VI secretion system Vgr family protein n=1 Tax=Aestuariibius insulae TaxID=2058287 RepID=UPI00345E4ECF